MVGVSKNLSCKACRQSRKKCDLQKPVCTRCRSTGLLCEWHEGSRFRFVGSSTQARPSGDRPRRSIEQDPAGDPESSTLSRVAHNPNRPVELAWQASRTPAEELGPIYSALIASFGSLASIPISMIGSTLNELVQASDQHGSTARPIVMLTSGQTLRDCSNREYMMWALLSALASRSHNCDAQYDPTLVNFIAGRAVEALNADISRQGRLNAYHLQAMRFLCAAEMYRRDFVAAKVHLRAARGMLNTNTFDDEQSNRYLSSMFLRADVTAAAYSLEKPIFPDIYDPGPPQMWLSNDLYDTTDQSSLQRMGSGLVHLPENIMPPVLMEIVEDVKVVTGVVAMHPSVSGSSDLTGCWLSARCDALHHRIWSVDTDNTRTRAVQLALICWVIVLQSPLSSAKLMAQPLQQALQELKDLPDEPPFRHTLMWTLFLGAMVNLSHDASWWMDELTTMIAQNAEYESRENLTNILKEHFLLENLHKDSIDTIMSMLYEDIMQTSSSEA